MDIFNKIPLFLNQPRWNLNCSDFKDKNMKIFWGMLLNQEKFFYHEIFNIIKKKTNKNFEISKILANAQSTLQDGSPHYDSTNTNAWTFILYVNEKWDYQWGGQTILFDRYVNDKGSIDVTSELFETVYPIPNTAIFFPSNMIHYAMGPSRDFNGIRYSIAYHLIEI